MQITGDDKTFYGTDIHPVNELPINISICVLQVQLLGLILIQNP